LTAPRGITQPPTSFIGSQCQGIHHAPLNTYNTKQLKILGRIKNCIIYTHNNTHPPKEGEHSCALDARNHYPQIKHHTPPPKQGNNNQPRTVSGAPPPPNGEDRNLSPVSHIRDEEIAGLLSQSPIVCLMINFSRRSITRNPYQPMFVVHQTPTHYRRRAIHRIAQDHRTPTVVGGLGSRGAP
jgi:hypothetical protein